MGRFGGDRDSKAVSDRLTSSHLQFIPAAAAKWVNKAVENWERMGNGGQSDGLLGSLFDSVVKERDPHLPGALRAFGVCAGANVKTAQRAKQMEARRNGGWHDRVLTVVPNEERFSRGRLDEVP